MLNNESAVMRPTPLQLRQRAPRTALVARSSLVARTSLLALSAGLVWLAAPVSAQQSQGRPASQQKAAPAPQPQATPRAETAAPPAASDAALRQRIEQLEEQLVDMQVVVGTLESLARGGGGSNAAGGRPSAGGDPGRVEQLETQVRALSQQVEQLMAQGRSQSGGVASNAASLPPAAPYSGRPAPGGFATTTTPAERDPIGQIIGGNNVPAPIPGQGQSSLPQATATDASSRQLYDTAYGLLLAQDYAAAEAAFDEFLRRYPGDPLAGNAQYWLGETFYVRGNFKSAATAFLKGYQTYGRSSKAPDSLLKLAMSLDRLGQRDAACSSYGELSIKFPNAPGAVRNRADNERRRLGCA